MLIKEKHIVVLYNRSIQRLDDPTITAGAEYFNNFSRSEIKLCLSLKCNENNSFFIC